jgi:putative ABC transport system permease protein
MGASRGRIVQQLLIEASLIALLAAVLGTAIAAGAIQALVALGPDSVPRLDELSLDWRILAFAVATALATTALFGLMPAVQAARHDPQDALRVEGRGTVSSTSRARLRGLVMVGEVALSVALLIGAGLLIRSFSRLQEVDPGFAATRVMTARVNLPGAAYPTAVSRRQFYERFLTDLHGRPGIEAAAISSGPPLSGDSTGGEVWLPSQPKEQAGSSAWRLVGPGYFAALGIRIRGREFSQQDGPESPPVCIISEELAAKYFPNDDPLGRTIIMGSFTETPHTIVGVARDVRTFGLDQDAGFVLYGSATQYAGWNPMTLVWRAAAPSVDTVKASLRSVDPIVPLSAISSMDDLLDRSLGPRRFNLYLLGAFAGVALALAAIGLFGVMAYLVAQRTREIGVRLALGATRGEVFRLVLGRGLLLAGVGAAGGVAAALWLTRAMESLLFAVSRTDPATFVAVPATLLAVAALACYVPARRAMRVDPAIALRAD